METPFTTEQFYLIFESYNSNIFPVQILILILGIFSLFMAISTRAGKNQVVGSLLGLFWFWMGTIYHIIFFSSINPLAYVFGILFILQGLFFLFETFKKKTLEFNYIGNLKGYLGIILVLLGLVIYPFISYFIGGSFSKIISFGLPCPTTIATFGFLLLTNHKFSKYLVIIPTLWALIGTTAATKFGVYQDFLLIISAIITIIYIFKKENHPTIIVQME